MKDEDDPEDKPGNNSGEKPGNSSEDQSMNNTEIKPEKPFKFGPHANVKNWKCSSLKKDYCEKESILLEASPRYCVLAGASLQQRQVAVV